MDDTPKKGTLYYSGYSGVTAATIASTLGRVLSASEMTTLTKTISSLEMTIARMCSRNFHLDYTYVEKFDTGCDTYRFANSPVLEVLKIILNGVTRYDSTLEDNTYEEGVDFSVYDDSIVFDIPIYNLRKRNALEIHYTIDSFWGDDVRSAITQWATDLLMTREYGGRDIKKFTFTTLSVEFQPTDDKSKLPPYVEEVINTYRKVLI